MKITADDWHFRGLVDGTLVIDLFLDNGQHALLEVNPMCNQGVPNGEIPEAVAFCEMPGEKLTQGASSGTARWLTRPPDRTCPWSNVQLPLALWQQIRDHLRHPGPSVPTTAILAAPDINLMTGKGPPQPVHRG